MKQEHASQNQTIDEVLKEQYGFVLNAELKPMKGGMETPVWLVQTDNGSYYAKVYEIDATNPERTSERIEEEAQLYTFLKDAGLNVPKIKPAKNGNNTILYESTEGRQAVLIMEKEDVNAASLLTITQPEMAKIATMVAKMHKASMGYPYKDAMTTEYADKPFDSLNKLLNSPNGGTYSRDELEYIKEIDAKMRQYILKNYPEGMLTKAVIHADLTLEHTPFLPNGEPYIFDFGDRLHGPIAYELAIFIVNLYEEGVSIDRLSELRTWLLDAYNETHQLTETDKKAITFFAAAKIMEIVEFLSDVATEENKPVYAEGLKRKYELAEHLINEAVKV